MSSMSKFKIFIKVGKKYLDILLGHFIQWTLYYPMSAFVKGSEAGNKYSYYIVEHTF